MTYYIDTNVWIYAITANLKYGESCRKILEDIEKGRTKAIISTQVLTEIIGVLYRQYKVKDTSDQLNAILSYPVNVFLVTPDIIRKASEYARDYKILPYDAIHIAILTNQAISKIVSADKEFDKIEFIQRVDPLDYE